MDRTIEVKVNGSHLTKDNKVAGVQHECNAKSLRITFDEGWDGFAKTVTFWDAKGQTAAKRILTEEFLEDSTKTTRIYRCPIPGEAMTAAGWCTFVIDGWMEGKRQRSLGDKLEVKPAPYAEDAREPADPTPSPVEQFQTQIDILLSKAITVVGPKASAMHNVILTDRMTGTKYALMVENGALTILQVADTIEATDMCLIDTVTGIGYEVVVDDGRIAIKEV